MIDVAVIGYAGRMGDAVVQAVTQADDMQMACGVDPNAAEALFPTFRTIREALDAVPFDVMVDFTQPDVVEDNIRAALPAGVDCVIGTTGLAPEKLEELSALAPEGTCLFVAPNFTIGAVLMMQFAKQAAPYFPEAEVIEYHHANKKDAPSGTATRTAAIIHEARGRVSEAPGKETARKEPAARSSKAFPCIPCAPWASLPVRRSCSAPWARRSPSGTIRGTACPTCPACCWQSATWPLIAA